MPRPAPGHPSPPDDPTTPRSASKLAVGLAVIAMLEALDYSTGPYVSFSLLFLVPVAWLAWTAGPTVGVLAAVFAVGGETLVDWAWPQVAGPGVYLWNAFSRVTVLVLAALAVARIRRNRDLLAVANARLDDLLAAEASAHEDTQRRLGLVVNALADYAIVLFDATDNARSWSAATPRVTGRAPSAIEGRSIAELFPAAEPSEDEPSLLARAYDADRTEIERWTLRADGERYWANLIVYTLGDPPPRRLLAIVRDATARKRSVEALRRARDEAIATMRDLETFSYTVAHDLRTPLRAIDGFGAMLEEDAAGQLDDQARAYIGRMRQAARRMGRLVDDLLEMSRLGRTPMRRMRVDLSSLARDLWQQLQASDPARAVDFLVAEGLAADADPHLMGALLRNVLENAWKFTSKQPRARIEVGAIPGTEPTFFVRDNGVGFDMQYVDRLFRPFERLHAIDEFEGTGIGLATVRNIAERHGGRAWAEAAVGRGATLYFTLPAPVPAEGA